MSSSDIKDLKIRDILTNKELVKVPAEMSVRDLCNLFAEKNITGAPVIGANNKLVGVVSVSDIARSEAIIELKGVLDLIFISASPEIKHEVERHLNENYAEPRVKDIMTPKPITLNPDDRCEAAVKLMLDNKIRRVIISDNGKLLGIITITDILNLVLKV
jgi:CBS domain-containing protein